MLPIGRCLLSIVILAGCTTPVVRAQAVAMHHLSENPQDLKVRQLWKLTLTPMPASQPALQYSLLPRYWEQRPGDATPFYLRVMMLESGLPDATRNAYRDHANAWTANQLEASVQEEIRTWLAAYDQLLEDLQVATYRERIEMDLRLRDLRGLEAIYFRLPEAQKTRDVARMLQIKVRLEISERRYDDAIETLRMGYRLAQFAAKTPTLINDLVGVAIANIMTHELVRLIGSPDAPNMYWAIVSLPRPLIDLREAFEHESGIGPQLFPFLKDAETARRTPQQWRQLIVDVLTSVHELTGDYADKNAPITAAEAEKLIAKGYPLAKASLLEDGMDPQVVDEMSEGQVIAIHVARGNRRFYEENLKSILLSYPEARQQWALPQPKLKLAPAAANNIDLKDGDVLRVFAILMPNFRLAWNAPMRIERQFAAIRAIEAIRMHAAAHDGKLPSSLAEITAVVVPKDPFLDQPFTYALDGSTAVLTTKAEGTDEIRSRDLSLRINDQGSRVSSAPEYTPGALRSNVSLAGTCHACPGTIPGDSILPAGHDRTIF